MTRVLAVDPGPIPGWALWEKRSENWAEVFHGGQFDTGWKGLVSYIDSVGEHIDILVVEDFFIGAATAKKSTVGSKETIEMIGMLRLLAWRHKMQFVLQSPADARTFSTADKVKRMGWWLAGNDHGQSATRHLLLYLVRNGLVPASRLLPSD